MKKAELYKLARFGVRRRLDELQIELTDLHEEFPDEFTVAPILPIRPEMKTGGNDWPADAKEELARVASANGQDHKHTDKEKRSAAARSLWTPERRAKQSRLIKRSIRAGKMKRKRAATKPAASNGNGNGHKGVQPWGARVWQRAHDFLLTRDDRTAWLKEIQEGANIATGPSFISAIVNHPDLFKRVETGKYKLIKEVEHP